MKVYIAGPISNDPDYMAKFQAAEERLLAEGYQVVNPAKNQGYSYKEYIDIGLFELMHCDAIYLLNGYETSKGAGVEYHYALVTDMIMMYEPATVQKDKKEPAYIDDVDELDEMVYVGGTERNG